MRTLSRRPQFRQTDALILRQIMDRIGVNIPPEEFVTGVHKAFLGSRERTIGEQLVRTFRECPSFLDFKGALVQARQLAPKEPSILAIGAGNGVPGRDSAYTAGVIQELFAGCRVTQLDLEPNTIYTEPERGYDLVVTHSLAHYFFDQAAFYSYLRACTLPTGAYVMGNEPNRRFWVNPEVQNSFRAMNRSDARKRALRHYLNPRFYLSLIFSALRAPNDNPASFERGVNLILKNDFNVQGNITLKEMNRITDPFFPDELPGDHPLGGNGIDWDKDVPAALTDFRLEWIAASRHLGKHNPNNLPPRWQKVNARLNARHPMDGNVFSALWRRVESR